MNSVRNIIIIVALLSVVTTITVAAQERFRIMEYNVENLFDTIPNPLRDDSDFLPNSSRQWTSERYWAKQGRLARVIAAAGGDVPVELVGLVEVENDTVLKHLTQRTSLAQLGYDYIVTDGPDVRGIDVALLYQPGRFRPVHREDLRVPQREGQRPTRDVLYVEGLLPTLDTLTLFVAHFPSRRGGKRMTEKQRCSAAQVVRHKVDSIQRQRPNALIVIMGDLNDEVYDKALRQTLRVVSPEMDDVPKQMFSKAQQPLYDLPPMATDLPQVDGTYYYQGKWERIDHIIVSASLLHPESPLKCVSKNTQILTLPLLLEQESDAITPRFRPKRTYLGTHYHGGVSDHLPLVVELKLCDL